MMKLFESKLRRLCESDLLRVLLDAEKEIEVAYSISRFDGYARRRLRRQARRIEDLKLKLLGARSWKPKYFHTGLFSYNAMYEIDKARRMRAASELAALAKELNARSDVAGGLPDDVDDILESLVTL